MVNGGKKEVIRESPVTEKVYLNNDILIADKSRYGFYGGIDMRLSKICVVSNKSLPIECEV